MARWEAKKKAKFDQGGKGRDGPKGGKDGFKGGKGKDRPKNNMKRSGGKSNGGGQNKRQKR